MTRIAFLADLHVDAYGTKTDPDTGLNARLVDVLGSLRWAAEDAWRQEADALVIAGDLTERRHAPAWLVALIRDAIVDGFRPSSDRPVIMIRGNHDGTFAGRSIADVLNQPAAGLYAYGSQPAAHLVGDVPNRVRLSLIPYVDRAWVRARAGEGATDQDVRADLADLVLTMARAFVAQHRANPDWAARTPHVLVLHQTISGAWLSDQQQAFLGSDDTVLNAVELATAGFDLVVAGHLHRHQVVFAGAGDGCDVIYPGSIDRVDFGEEAQAKGYVLADLAPGSTTWQFVPNPQARRFVTVRDDDLDDADVAGAIVRGVDLDPGLDVDQARAWLLDRGAWDVRTLLKRSTTAASSGGIAEGLTPQQAVRDYLADDDDREALLALAGPILEAAQHG